MVHSVRCRDLDTYWDRDMKQCVPCERMAGFEVTPNCGHDDEGGQHEAPVKPCEPDTFNDGSRADCQSCSVCPPGHSTTACTSTNDTVCHDPISVTTKVPVTTLIFPVSGLPRNVTATQNVSSVIWAVPLTILICIMLAVISAYIVRVKRRRGHLIEMRYDRKPSYTNQGFSPLSASAGTRDPEDILSDNILSAPLQTVLDNLDVLEELVILLDPESLGKKNTKHLASHCSFPSTWITYTYSMKDSKSPLKAVLEAVTCKYPDWTVGHLAKLLRSMERNDAVAVLARLELNEA